MDIIKKITGNGGDGDVVYIQLISFNKEQKEVKGPFKEG